MSASVALVFPPVWYYTAVPADLSETAGALRAAGHRVQVHDLNAQLHADLFGDLAGFAALRRPDTYADRDRHARASGELLERAAAISASSGARYTLRLLSFPGLDLADVAAARAAGLERSKNPAFATLERAAVSLRESEPTLVALALTHPEQIPHTLALAALLRDEGFTGKILLYGALEDVLSPADFAEDLPGEPRHALFDDLDAVIAGETERALLSLADRWPASPEEVPGVVTAQGAGPAPLPMDLGAQPPPSFEGIVPELYMSPGPVVDLRLGRGCPWGRCAFCAIQAHQPGYRAGTVDRLVQAMRAAHEALGSVFFRVRDDLLTPSQLAAVGEAVGELDFKPRWSARARLDRGLTAGALEKAAAGGLEELWLGLESGSERSRDRMDKGVRDADVSRILSDGAALGLRMRMLCLVGFPGEGRAEAVSTLRFVSEHASQLSGFALSRFQLMRASPMAQRPDTYNVRLLEDPLPREARLRWSLPFEAQDTLSGAECDAIISRAYALVLPRFPAVLGPDLHHDWVSASVRRGGWPGG